MEKKTAEKLEKILESHKKPVPMPGAVPWYEREDSRIPEKIRISFSDGTTAVYDLHVDQPAPLIVESIRIIRKWNTGYQYKAPRRRRDRK